jgi:hypothetical protein
MVRAHRNPQDKRFITNLRWNLFDHDDGNIFPTRRF